ncbi:MAG: hypothetical protein JXR81_08160 [Candidatus Goldbacteria bacterium]|nr:hypothetical protein [Candidatus Goldiibacteriota bacterium]
MENVFDYIAITLMLILFFVSFISVIMFAYYHLKMIRDIEKINPDLADLVYGINFRRFNWKEWGKLIKFNTAGYPEFAAKIKKRNFFIYTMMISVVLFVIISFIVVLKVQGNF